MGQTEQRLGVGGRGGILVGKGGEAHDEAEVSVVNGRRQLLSSGRGRGRGYKDTSGRGSANMVGVKGDELAGSEMDVATYGWREGVLIIVLGSEWWT